jgi:hypothetical protein
MSSRNYETLPGECSRRFMCAVLHTNTKRKDSKEAEVGAGACMLDYTGSNDQLERRVGRKWS